jgi:hypothetical protein
MEGAKVEAETAEAEAEAEAEEEAEAGGGSEERRALLLPAVKPGAGFIAPNK